ncbi:hypothetical protein N308_11297, partial [Struthio camelus australis]
RSSPAALCASCNEFSRGAGHSHHYVQQESTLTWYLETSCSGGKIYPILFSYLVAENSGLPLPAPQRKIPCNQNQESKPPELDSFPFWKCSA